MSFSRKRVKISVFGKNNLVKSILSHLISGIDKENDTYVGGYQPINFNLEIDREEIDTQFFLVDYERENAILPDILIELSHGLLFLVDGLDKEQTEKIKAITENLLKQRKRELFVSYIGIVQSQMNERELSKFVDSIQSLADILKINDNFNVYYALAPDLEYVISLIKDLIQTSKILAVL
ncbi:MAG: hypothetical protein ACTSQE_13725 [Candidatus Heimdallarchaeaceae archaeon]